MKDSQIVIELKSKERSLSLSDLEGSFDEAIEVVSKWKEQYTSECKDGEFCKLDFGYYGYDGASELLVKYYRYENEQEKYKRKLAEQEKENKAKLKEIAQLKSLQAKYPNINIGCDEEK